MPPGTLRTIEEGAAQEPALCDGRAVRFRMSARGGSATPCSQARMALLPARRKKDEKRSERVGEAEEARGPPSVFRGQGPVEVPHQGGARCHGQRQTEPQGPRGHRRVAPGRDLA